jgi:hypothetical protein
MLEELLDDMSIDLGGQVAFWEQLQMSLCRISEAALQDEVSLTSTTEAFHWVGIICRFVLTDSWLMCRRIWTNFGEKSQDLRRSDVGYPINECQVQR